MGQQLEARIGLEEGERCDPFPWRDGRAADRGEKVTDDHHHQSSKPHIYITLPIAQVIQELSLGNYRDTGNGDDDGYPP